MTHDSCPAPPDACEGCDGSGRRDPAAPDCALRVPAGWHVLERCDACARFPSDEDVARRRHGERVRIVVCADGGAHVIVPDRPASGLLGRFALRPLVNRLVAALRRARRPRAILVPNPFTTTVETFA